MIKYQETIEQSAEYLRLALPLMSRQAAALHPVSYGVWYEYVAGYNKPLRDAVDLLTQDGKVLDEALTSELYRNHIAELDERTAHRIASGFRKVMADVAQNAADAGEHANRFGNTLEQFTEVLGNPESAAVAGVGVGLSRLLSGTRGMQGAIATLQERLDASRREVEKLQQEVERAREAALVDALTGLVNRRGFDLALAACLAEQTAAGTCLLLADIDHFKNVNDTYGHVVGDKVLHAVAQVLKASVKGRDTAARFGGEEFVVLLPETSLDGAQALAENLRTRIEGSRIRRSDNRQEIGRVTASFGVACHCAGESAKDFVSRADSALYASKKQGRNRVTAAPMPML